MTGCPLCGVPTDPRLLAKSIELRTPIIAQIQLQDPTWQPGRGICPQCALSHARHFASQRSSTPLNTTTTPHTTFPYYHREEETVYSQPERLPDYQHFDGDGVTIAFLDSGYYPHPDLAVRSAWSSFPVWQEMDSHELQAVLSQSELRIAHYADLTDQGIRLGLDTSSLWDSEGDSWHGQMTSVIAAGNGFLSDGRYRGYAHAARILPIKIGRGGGRIPEDDILSGLRWLLHNDNWLRHDVRVLNLSVGGDFAQPWSKNAVCLAAEKLSERGLLVTAAAGNRGTAQLLAPAQAPSVLTVGGVDDANLPWHIGYSHNLGQVSLYHHNWGRIENGRNSIHKPELLALGQWLPSPVLPPAPIFKEMHAISSLRSTLRGQPSDRLDAMLAHWHRTLHLDPLYVKSHPGQTRAAWLAEMDQALRRRMNAHKWIHAYYQHVDGTSVAVAQVSAVAAQVVQANPALTPAQIKSLLMQTALPLSHLPLERSGAGLLQPAAAVAAALRTNGGPLTGYPRSGVPLGRPQSTTCTVPAGPHGNELHKQRIRGTVSAIGHSGAQDLLPVYFGVLAPGARDVSLIGAFNEWKPDVHRLQQGRNGWWNLEVPLARCHAYRFWIVDSQHPTGDWRPDSENPCQLESGYVQCHSAIRVNMG